MHKNSLLLLICLFPVILFAQNKTDSEMNLICRIADKILQDHAYEIINTETEICYTYTKNLPTGKNYRIKSRYLEWRYVNGVLNMAMLHLGATTGNTAYRDFVLDNYRFLFANKAYLQKQYDSGIRDYGYYRFLRMGSLDDCGAMVAALIETNETDPHQEYVDYIDRTADYILNRQSRLPEGAFSRGKAERATVWLDDLYMSVSFLANRAYYFQDADALNTAIQQVIQFSQLLYEPRNGLYYHCYYDYLRHPGVAHWGRANGWGILAQSKLLAVVPQNHPRRKELLDIFRRQILGFSRYQSESGMWHQLLDKSDSYPETSCTAMFAYAVAKGINEGWLDGGFAGIALKAWDGIETYVTEKGEVNNICIGTGIAHDLIFYYQRPAPLNDVHGLGAIIEAGLEINKLKKLLQDETNL
ncbi:MAG: glycoside hydrolase family 105 protein [Mangrovibacterium sp.]